ncbi:NrsF family protein [Rhodanobacter sp. Si-c]|uniref:NrsF family protein n=1 Tax=Rhodanobacter lycopersici TaxID=3162487 RepID=A0ABV3QEK6_9GAMM
MSADPRQQSLIVSLGAGLTPVRRLRSPWLRMLVWALLVAVIAALLLWHSGATAMLRRWAGAPDLAWATVGAVLTAVGAAWAALALAVPGRSRAWAWLPLPGALLWIGASGLGCLQPWLAPGTTIASAYQSTVHCLTFIVVISIPLSALLLWLLRRACPLRPALTACLLGLASAAASAALLAIFHPFESTVSDLLVHGLAVTIVVAINAAWGNRLLLRHRM